MNRPKSISLVALTLALVSPALLAVAEGDDWRRKVDPWVLDGARAGDTEFIVFLAEQADLGAAERLGSKLEKGTFVYETLSSLARESQKPMLVELAARGVEHRSYWVANMIWVRGDLPTVEAMAERPDVLHVYANPRVTMDGPVRADAGEPDNSPEAVEWNISHVNADQVWSLGFTGTGAVVGGQDTGYRWDHAALINQYRGGPQGEHDYNWHDAIHSGGGSCGADAAAPCDDHGHGTHTMGTIVGDDGEGNQVGMAPGARWIGCRNMDVGTGTPVTYSECYQWFIAPTDLNDQNPDPAMAPDVINNSWGCPASEGCTDPNVLLTVVQNVRAAGIVTVHSAGNEGSSCSSVQTPAGIYEESFSVGATNSSDAIAGFSSRGPVTVDGSNRRKPDISAPGVSIRSSTRDGGYQGGWDGTSMAGPHVAGLVALLIDVNPGLAGDVDLAEQIIEQTAVPLTTTQGCGGDSSTDVPNNVFGWGRIDALAAANYSLDFLLAASPEQRAVCVPGAAQYTIDVLQFQGFGEEVLLSTTNLPTGTTESFSANPVIPPASSVLTIDAASDAPTGSSTITVTGTSMPSAIVHETTVVLDLFDQVPTAPMPAAPVDGAVDVVPAPTLVWSAAVQGATYTVEVALDAAFQNQVYSAPTAETEHAITIVLDPTTEYFWRVGVANACGDGPSSSSFSFTTADIPPILLVDDDDNNPDVRAAYTATLDALGLSYDVWDTNNSDSSEPTASDLAPYLVVIWFTGDEFGGAAGPGAATETALGAWLDTGRCLFVSAQDYHFDKDLTGFMQTYLGVLVADDDVGQDAVTGAGSVFAGLGPYVLSYPFTNYSDEITPGAGAELAFSGDAAGQTDAAVTVDGGIYRTAFWGFPFEALPTEADRLTALTRFLTWCEPFSADPVFSDGFATGDTSRWSLTVN